MRSYKLTRSFFTLLLIMSANCGISTIDNKLTFQQAMIYFEPFDTKSYVFYSGRTGDGPFVVSDCEAIVSNHFRSKLQRPDIIASELFFNTQFLSHYDLIANILIKEEKFEEVYFKSEDGIRLNGLLRKNLNAPYSIIFCAGFYPGRKEGLASFIKLVPKNTNILFFDARGHGKSEGRFFTNLHNYGIDEYKDIIGALQFLKRETNAPIFIHGICAGAFHAANALTKIDCQEYNIKGFIFDSGLPSLLMACHVPEKHFREKVIPGLFLALYSNDTKLEVKERYLCKAFCSITGLTLKIITALIKPHLEKKHGKINLLNKINTITCPILYIHSYDDSYSPIQPIFSLAEKTARKTCWWINSSEHALHHIKHKNEYLQILKTFLENQP